MYLILPVAKYARSLYEDVAAVTCDDVLKRDGGLYDSAEVPRYQLPLEEIPYRKLNQNLDD